MTRLHKQILTGVFLAFLVVWLGACYLDPTPELADMDIDLHHQP